MYIDRSIDIQNKPYSHFVFEPNGSNYATRRSYSLLSSIHLSKCSQRDFSLWDLTCYIEFSLDIVYSVVFYTVGTKSSKLWTFSDTPHLHSSSMFSKQISPNWVIDQFNAFLRLKSLKCQHQSFYILCFFPVANRSNIYWIVFVVVNL